MNGQIVSARTEMKAKMATERTNRVLVRRRIEIALKIKILSMAEGCRDDRSA